MPGKALENTWLLPHVTSSVTSRIRNIQKYGGRSVQKDHIFKTQPRILIKFWHEVPNINIMRRSEFRQWAIPRSGKIADDCRQLVSYCKSVSVLWFNAGHASAWYSGSLYTHYSIIESQHESSTTWLLVLPHVTFSVTSRIRNIPTEIWGQICSEESYLQDATSYLDQILTRGSKYQHNETLRVSSVSDS